MLSAPEITEINALIAEIEKLIKPTSEIGARDKATLTSLLKANKETKVLKCFACKREYSDAIVLHFMKEKGVAKNRFHMKSQTSVYVLN